MPTIDNQHDKNTRVTADVKAQAEAEVERLREALDRVKAHTRLFKEDSRSLLRLRMQAVYEEATTALCQHGSVLRTSDGIHACLECGAALAGSPS